MLRIIIDQIILIMSKVTLVIIKVHSLYKNKNADSNLSMAKYKSSMDGNETNKLVACNFLIMF